MANTKSPPDLDFIFAAHVTVDPAHDLGDVAKGGRRIVPITGGEFAGPQLRGKVLPGGADWQIYAATAWPNWRRAIRCGLMTAR